MVRAALRAMARESSLVKGRKRLYAGALAFKTVLALAPAMAIFLGVLLHEGLRGPREAVLDRVVNGVYPLRAGDRSGSEGIRDLNEAAKRQVKDSLQRYADRAEAAGWLGLAVFIGVLIFLLHDVEDAFNFLWKIPKARPLRAQILLYSSLLLAVPLLMAAAVGAQAWMEERGPLGTILEGWIPGFLGMWMAWTVVLKWVPNIRVKWLPAAWGAFLALLLFEATRWGLGVPFEYLVGSFRFYGRSGCCR